MTDHYQSAATVLETNGQHSGQGSVETLYNITDWVERQQFLLKVHENAVVL